VDALTMSGTMTWRITWSLILGFTLAAIIEALVRKSTIAALLPDGQVRRRVDYLLDSVTWRTRLHCRARSSPMAPYDSAPGRNRTFRRCCMPFTTPGSRNSPTGRP
jgi:hypothetical protein